MRENYICLRGLALLNPKSADLFTIAAMNDNYLSEHDIAFLDKREVHKDIMNHRCRRGSGYSYENAFSEPAGYTDNICTSAD
jgi:hypothetical protein